MMRGAVAKILEDVFANALRRSTLLYSTECGSNRSIRSGNW